MFSLFNYNVNQIISSFVSKIKLLNLKISKELKLIDFLLVFIQWFYNDSFYECLSMSRVNCTNIFKLLYGMIYLYSALFYLDVLKIVYEQDQNVVLDDLILLSKLILILKTDNYLEIIGDSDKINSMLIGSLSLISLIIEHTVSLFYILLIN